MTCLSHGGRNVYRSEAPSNELLVATTDGVVHLSRPETKAGWRVSGPRGAARVLGLKATTLESRMKRLGITRPRPSAHSQQP